MTPAETLKREQAKAAREKLEAALWQQMRATLGADGGSVPTPCRQHRFHPTRKWCFDVSFPERMLAVEVDGGTWSGGRHTRGAGYEKDCEKLNEALCLGWRVIRVTGAHIKSGKAIEWIERALK